MFQIVPATMKDFDALSAIDRYIPSAELKKKIETRPEQVLVLKEDDVVVGVLRYALFWDYIPYTCFLNVSETCRGKGYAKKALLFWEDEMKKAGWPMIMTSIPTDDGAQHFYRKQGYKDSGCFTLNEGMFKQAMEILFSKCLDIEGPAMVGDIYKQ